MFLTCCLNGVRQRSEHPALPITPLELARDVARVVAAGADAVHIHAKHHAGSDTLDPAILSAALSAIRADSPGLPVGTTTGEWTETEPGSRLAAIARWTVLPDFASVNWHEPGAESIAAALMARGVGVEAGLWTIDAVRTWAASPLRDRCIRVLVELGEGLSASETVAEGDRIVDAVRAFLDSGAPPILLHGQGSSTWPALRHAAALGLQGRIGLEDVLTLPDGRPAADNAALVVAARAR
ncbi:MAG: 3-keto-5-aminohexanoate cleavage protein [Sporichthyaceae bacterium]